MATFHVDPDSLGQLSYQLEAIYDSLTSAKADFQAAEPTMGSSVAADALSSFCSGWTDGRSKIENETKSLAESIAGVVQTYRDTDADITGSLTRHPVHRGH